MGLSSPIWRRRRRGGFNPASIAGLQQVLFNKRLPVGSTVFDESPNMGDARGVVTGSDYLFNGTTQYVQTGLNFNTFCADSFNIDVWLNPTDGQPAASQLVLGGQDNATGLGVQGTLANNGVIVAIETSGVLSFAYKAGGNYAISQTAAAVFVNGAQPAPRKFRFTATAGAGLTIGEFLTPLISNVVTPIALGINGLFSTNNVVMSSFSYNANLFFGARNSLGTANSFYAGEVFGLQISNASFVDYAFYKCSERSGTAAYDSSGNARTGTLIGGVTHSTQNIYSWNNEVGYTAGTGSNGAAVGVFIPRNEASILFDVLGNSLGFKGRAPNNALMINSSCVSYNGTTQYALTTCNPTAAGSIETRFILTALNASNVILAGVRDATDTRCYLSLNNNVLSGGIGSQLFTTITGGGTLTTGVEYVGKIEWTGTTVTLSLNGAVVYSAAQAGVVGTTRPFAIAAFNDVGTINGFSNARVYDTVFRDGAGVIQGSYAAAESSGATLFDKSSFGRHATLVNAPTWATQNGFHNNVINGFSRYPVFDGADDVVSMAGVSILNNSSNAFRIKFKMYSFSIAGVRRIVAQQTGSTSFKGVSVYTNGDVLALDIINNATASINQLSARIKGFTPSANTYYDIEVIYSGNKLATGVTWIINGVTYSSVGLVQTLSSDDVASGTNFTVGNDSGVSSYWYNGFVWDVEILNGSGTLLHHWDGFGAANSDWIDSVGGNNGTVSGSPAIRMIPAVNSTIDAIGAPTRNPAGVWHNGAGTQLDLTGGVASPAAVQGSWETAWAFNTARTNPRFKRTTTKNGSDYRADRFLAYQSTLSGADLTKAENATATRAI